jgi:hypothetical protein
MPADAANESRQLPASEAALRFERWTCRYQPRLPHHVALPLAIWNICSARCAAAARAETELLSDKLT